eukprot:CAMPEP_0174262294 /NCGR_PEP_ID=MMETSP0439-20130205/12895_1 /TAXON_ID=0 /ORGANISM="Stereomyxa ramosa, Strain Chinc5" /LENGTH=348 /DNA_ID=CAMNT_0015346985 /DNA_START=410 /DNA_END=1452 /DNA_ORIENTATION=-
MLFGSFIAGATSEGGGSIAFPVMTLLLGLSPKVAADFSLMIQSIGMTSASFSIVYSGILIEKTAILWGTAGGTFGIVVGLQFIAPNLPSDMTKMLFVSVWFAFAINLFVLNRFKHRHTHLTLQHPTYWKFVVLMATGFVGGVLSSISGSGLDICTFSVLTLLFRLSEKTATPTSVILMAINTCVGFYFQGAVLQEIDDDTWGYWVAAIPAVALGAPVGAFVSSFLHRQVLACFVYVTDTTQFIVALIIVPQTWLLQVITWVTLFGCICMFAFFAVAGFYLLRYDELMTERNALLALVVSEKELQEVEGKDDSKDVTLFVGEPVLEEEIEEDGWSSLSKVAHREEMDIL